jgi:hypothetical protein
VVVVRDHHDVAVTGVVGATAGMARAAVLLGPLAREDTVATGVGVDEVSPPVSPPPAIRAVAYPSQSIWMSS